MTPKQKTYGLIVLIALTISVVLYNFVLLKQIPKLNVIDKSYNSVPGKITESLYHDLNKNGIKERLDLHNTNRDSSIFSLVITKPINETVSQYNFSGSRMRMEWIDFVDIVGDSTDEIIPFYDRNDSIFCSIIDYSHDKFLEKDIFVLAKPDTIYANTWGPALCVVGNIRNSLGEMEIIFSISTGFSQIPRGVFAFNIAKKKITKKFLMGAAINQVKIFDLTKNGKKEIIINTFSPANNGHLPKLPYYNDFKSWLIVLNNNFDTLFTKCINKPFGGISSNYLIGKQSNFIISLATKVPSNSLYKINSTGEIIKQLTLPNGTSNFLRNQIQDESENIIIPIDKDLYIFDSNLNLVEKHSFNGNIINSFPINLDLDKPNEYILCENDKIEILDDDYSVITSINKIFQTDDNSLITYSESPLGKKITLNYRDGWFDFDLNRNPIYKMRYLFFAGIFLTLFLIVLLLNNITNRTLVFLRLLNISTKKSNKGIIIVTPKMKYSFINSSAKKILNLGRKAFAKKKDFNGLINNNKSLSKFLDSAFFEAKAKVADIYLNKDRIIKVKVLPIKSPLGLLLAYYIQIDDLTKILQTDRSKIIAHSIQKVAHEIKTPLSSVLLSLDSLEQDWNNNTNKMSITEDISVARKEIDRVKKFINNFLKFANMAGTQVDSFNLKEIIESSLVRFSTYLYKGIDIKLAVPENITVLVDHFQMEEVFQVFIENGIDAMHGKGIIEIVAKPTGNNIVKISIKDTGDGISEEEITSIFQPYMTTKKDGTGMGLAIAKKIIEEHGGKIRVRSTVDVGTEFSFNLRTNVVLD